MKKSDIAMVVLIASVSMMIAYFVANSILGGGSGYSQKIKTIDKINSTIVAPDSSIFNKNAINPSVKVQINSSGAAQPGAQ